MSARSAFGVGVTRMSRAVARASAALPSLWDHASGRIQRVGLLAAFAGLLAPVAAQATLTVTPLTWNVVGLDSNSPTAGPKFFPAGARVCSNVATSNVAVNWTWDTANANVNLRTGSLSSITLASIAAGACADAYFEIEVNQVPAAYDTVRRYHITAADGSGAVSTPTPREIYVEHLISQNRNSITGVKLNGVSIPAGGSMSLLVGNTYTIELDGGTATQGYNQFESFINFPNTIFQVLSVSTTYSADNSPYVPGPAPIASDKLYADACLWQSDPTSPNYRSCIGGDFKAGGTSVVTTYTIKVISGGGTAQTLNSLLYDFSGSSYHYNSDFGVNAIIANIVDPTALTISKAFAPAQTVAGGTSTLTFTLSNPNPSPISGASFTDPLPALSGNQMVVASPATFSTSGCGSPTFAPTAGASAISFANGTVAANSTCSVSVLVSVPSVPTTGSYANTSGNLFVGGVDTGHFASASLGLISTTAGAGVCGLTLANWTVPNGTTANPPDLAGGIPTIKASNVSTATASANVSADTAILTSSGQNDTTSWQTFGYKDAGNYIQFVVDTRNYTGVQLSFYVGNPSPANGPTNIALDYDRGSGFTNILNIASPAAAFTQHTIDFTSLTSTTGSTTFRLTATGAKNNNAGASLNYDNIAFTGCGIPAQPTLAKAFSANPVAVNGTSTLTFTLTNPNTTQLTGAKFTDALPAGLQVAASPSASTTCGGSPTWAPSAGSTSLAFGQTTGGTIPASGSCTASVNVTATTAGPHTNVSGFISTTEGGTNSGASGSGTASLTAIVPPTIAKSFSPNPIQVNGASLLTFTITNPNPSDMLTGVSFADTYPAGLVNVNPLSPPVSNTCGGAVATVAGGNTVSLTGGTLAAGASCTVSVTVTSAAAGAYANTSGNVGATTAGAGNTASASLTVNPPHPAIGVKKQVGASVTGPWFDFVSVAPGSSLYYQFTAENIGDVALNPFNVSDPTLAGTGADPAGCTWQTTNSPSTLPSLPVATATIDPTAMCVVGPVVAAAGDHPNTATAHGTYSGNVSDSKPASADYIGAVPGFSLLKQIGTSATGPWLSHIGVASGDNVFYKFTLINTGAFALSSISVTDPLVSTATCTFTDPLPVGGATTCAVGPVVASGSAGSTTTNTATGNGTNGSTFHTAPSSASYSIGSVVADLAITKDDGTASVTAGGTTTYTLTVTNNGPAEVTNATVVDAAPAGMTVGSWTCTVTNPGSGGSVTTACGAGSGSGNINTTVTMRNGAVITYSVPASIAPDATGSLSNTATATVPAGVIDPVSGNDSATDTDTVNVVADLSITKTDGVSSVVPGSSTIYTIVVANNGPSSVTGASVSDLLPAAIASDTYAAIASGGATGFTASGSGNISDTVNMPAGSTITYTVTASVAASATGTLTNTATVSTPGGVTDPNPANNAATDSDTLTPHADLAITKTDGVASVTAGASTIYTIVVANNGPSSVTGATVSDTLPAAITSDTFTAVASGGATGFTASGSGNISDAVNMPVGSTITYTVKANIGSSATGSLVNTATVSAPGGVTDTNPANNSATDTDSITPATPVADLSITKTDGVTSVNAGAGTVYTIVATNNGPSAVTGATVTDTAPSGLTIGSWTCVASAGSSCPASGSGNVSASVNLLNGGTATFTVNATVAASATGSISNTASIAVPAGVNDPTPGNNSATDTDTVNVVADLAITKTDGVTTATPGGSTAYTIVVSNNGPSNVTGASITDLMPAAIVSDTYTAIQSGGATGFTASGSGNISDTVNMPGGSTITYTLTANIGASATGSLTNTATVTAPAGVTDSNLSNNSATDTDTLAPQVTLAVVKTDGSASYTPGGTATYTITVTDTGTSDAANVSVSDTMPAGMTLTGAANCVANGTASCGAVTGLAGDASFAATGASLAAGGGNSLVFTVPVAFASNLTTDPLINTASATDIATGATASGFDSDARSLDVTLAVVKSDGSTTYTPGGTATYTVTVTHGGVSDATNVTVADSLPAGVTLTGTVTCLAGGSASCGTVTGLSGQTSFGATGAHIAAGPGNSLTFTAPVAFSAGLVTDPLVNTASATDVPSGANGSGSDSDTRSPQVSLTVAKTDNSATYTPGGTGTYAITVGNTGVTDALDVSVDDTLPSGVTLTGDVLCTANGTATCGTVTGTTGDTSFTVTGATIAAGGVNTLVLTVPVAFASNLTDDPLVNSATAKDLATGASGSGSDSDLRAALSGLGITKTDGSTTYTPGGTATYTIVVTNAGPADATDTTVSDTLPSGVTLSANATCLASGTATCGAVTGLTGQSSFGTTGATIAAGVGNALTFTAPVAFASSLTANPLTNTATATDPSSAPATVSDSDTLNADVELVITKTDGATTVTAGGTTTYTIVVSNGGPSDATGASVVDTLPASFTAATWTCAPTGGATCTASGTGNISDTVNVPVGATLTYTVQATLSGSASGTVTNTSTVGAGAGETDTNPGNNSASDSDTVTAGPPPTADVSITKSDGVASLVAGSTTTYTIVVANAGPAAANGTIFTDPAVANLTVTAVACSSPSGGAACPAPASTTVGLMQGSGIVIPTLPSGGSVTFTVSATVSPGATGTIVNTASIAAPAGVTDPTLANNSAADTDAVTPATGSADLQITKTHSGGLTSGATAVYTILVSNAGPQAANGATVADPVTTGLNKISVACGGATGGAQCPVNPTVAQLESGIAIWTFPANSSVTFTVTVRVTALGGSVSNTATVTPPIGITDPNTGDNQMIDSGTVSPGGGGGGGPGYAQPIPALDPRSLALLVIAMAVIGARFTRRRLRILGGRRH